MNKAQHAPILMIELRNMLHPITSAMLLHKDFTQAVPHSSQGLHRSQPVKLNKPWVAKSYSRHQRSCAPLHHRKPKWNLWPVSSKCCDLLMSDHLVSCSLLIPIRPHLQLEPLCCTANCSCTPCSTLDSRGQHDIQSRGQLLQALKSSSASCGTQTATPKPRSAYSAS